jgi:protoporphyrinogen oxidase
VVIVGAGPAGVGAAYRLTQTRRAQVTVLEGNDGPGGLASSFELAGHRVDYGSHRLHPACDPVILADIRRLLGGDLLDRPRHGRLRLRGRWIHFPLKPFDLLCSLPPGFALGAAMDGLKKACRLGRRPPAEETFASVLEHGLGRRICRDFYFPYARKIWGLEPNQLSAIQARRRVQAGSVGKLFQKVLRAVPGFRRRGGGRFYYPREGFGQITRRFYEAARAHGADFRFGAVVDAVHVGSQGVEAVSFHQNGTSTTLPADLVWSTIPVSVLLRCLRPAPPDDVFLATQKVRYRSMILIYLVIAQARFSEFDAHYFPEAAVPITRLSEPRNYTGVERPTDRTVLCAELPCDATDACWSMSDYALGVLVKDALAMAGIPVRAAVLDVRTRRLPHAYPIYQRGYEGPLAVMDAWLARNPRLLTLGRQGLFAHDNTHHTLAMAYAAVDCLNEAGQFDRAKWKDYCAVFATHVVED